jgi:hypothetical protein
MITQSILFVMLLLALPAQAQQPDTATYQLKPTPKTVAWGYYDASTPPVMRIESGVSIIPACRH